MVVDLSLFPPRLTRTEGAVWLQVGMPDVGFFDFLSFEGAGGDAMVRYGTVHAVVAAGPPREGGGGRRQRERPRYRDQTETMG
jgi:hypothetical protein